jgi:hypothetical protein
LEDWRKQNQEEAKEIVILTQQANKSTKWKALRIIFSPTHIYQALELLAEKPIVSIAQAIIEETLSSPNEKTK